MTVRAADILDQVHAIDPLEKISSRAPLAICGEGPGQVIVRLRRYGVRGDRGLAPEARAMAVCWDEFQVPDEGCSCAFREGDTLALDEVQDEHEIFYC
jgi:hypothetical protein